uniref:Ras-related protein Rab-8A n=1 Tax=Cacopsylla melanoneura TaxID=428564 RepID=A0A8D8YG89_9HEMI
MTDCNQIYKILVLGDSNVGKTCIVHRFCDETYYDTYISTIGIDFKQKIIDLDDVPTKLQIWDTAGQERFRTLTTAYYRGAMGILLMYDVTNLESFQHLTYWLKNIEELAENYSLPFYEVSCKQNINIDESFLTLARLIREQTRLQKFQPAEPIDHMANISLTTSRSKYFDTENIKENIKCQSC